ncbi:MAG: S24 family peptidase [Chloroflexi bacterium]|nr:S24 family peptidase [Chloroflexota bacterium]
MPENELAVGRSYKIRKSLDKQLNHLKAEHDRDKTDIVNDAIELYLSGANLPVVGRVCAGTGTPAAEDVEERLTLPEQVANRADYLLRVTGDSMEPVLSPGDLVGVRTAAAPSDGCLVVALLVGDAEDGEGEREGVVKRYVKQEKEAYLESYDPAYPKASAHNYDIIGKVVTIIRLLE